MGVDFFLWKLPILFFFVMRMSFIVGISRRSGTYLEKTVEHSGRDRPVCSRAFFTLLKKNPRTDFQTSTYLFD
ncbi:hypothetical protein [Fulmarus glacialis papillomavirus 1]|uniref:Uncharacterized protein n=1 Tax=Fulmarus glacialis papillomavirus 1 TaxID=1463817 RepID=A0A059TB09_9PAPI|nr:hypothetical protein [Fulmarus glacialis papillomavirus 1]AHV82126.1 hypothetical protein [Fulmarus glacialis papillomavirus 1]